MALEFRKITHCARSLLSGTMPWNESGEELTVYPGVPAAGVPSGLEVQQEPRAGYSAKSLDGIDLGRAL